MIASDLDRAVVALAFVFTIHQPRPWLLYLLSAALMFASPVLYQRPRRHPPHYRQRRRTARRQFPHPDHAVGHPHRRHPAGRVQRRPASDISGPSFSIRFPSSSRPAPSGDIAAPGGFRAPRDRDAGAARGRPWHEYRAGLAYMRSVPLMMGIAMISVGWAMGGGAAQILFALFGERVFHRGAAGIGAIWGFAGIGLLAGRRHRPLRRPARPASPDTSARSRFPTLCTARPTCSSARPDPSPAALDRHDVLPRGHGRHHRAQQCSTPAPHPGPVPRPGLRHHGIAALVGDDRLDGRGGHRLAVCQPPGHRLVAGAFGLLTALAWAWYDWSGRLTEPPAPPEESDLAESDVVDAHWT